MFLPHNLTQRKRKKNLILFAHMCVHIHTVLVWSVWKLEDSLQEQLSCSLGSGDQDQVAPPADPYHQLFETYINMFNKL